MAEASSATQQQLPRGPGADALVSRSCAGACCRDIPLLGTDAVAAHLASSLPSWTLDGDGKRISKSFVAKNWSAAVAFLNSVSVLAEAEGHHPDVHLTQYRNVTVSVGTHAIDGLSEYDFVLAAKIDTLDVEFSPKWLREHLATVAAPP